MGYLVGVVVICGGLIVIDAIIQGFNNLVTFIKEGK